MLNKKKALLLVGSPKMKKSTSEALGSYLLEGLHKQGCTCEKLHVLSALKNGVEELLDKVNDTDILIISFPLYVDTLPAPLIKALELITDSRRKRAFNPKQSLVAIVNSGFPEAIHSETVLKILKVFADKTNFKWLGGLSMGCGPAINGRPIEQIGGMARNIVKALDMSIESIVNDDAVPSKAIELMSKNLFPVWLYTFFGNQSWRTQAKKFNMHKQLYAKPYIKE